MVATFSHRFYDMISLITRMISGKLKSDDSTPVLMSNSSHQLSTLVTEKNSFRNIQLSSRFHFQRISGILIETFLSCFFFPYSCVTKWFDCNFASNVSVTLPQNSTHIRHRLKNLQPMNWNQKIILFLSSFNTIFL